MCGVQPARAGDFVPIGNQRIDAGLPGARIREHDAMPGTALRSIISPVVAGNAMCGKRMPCRCAAAPSSSGTGKLSGRTSGLCVLMGLRAREPAV